MHEQAQLELSYITEELRIASLKSLGATRRTDGVRFV